MIMTKETRLFLTLLAGFCDSATFVHMHGIFSAHVTGNFVVFAAALSQGAAPEDYFKLITFPVFVFSVATATACYMWADKRKTSKSSGLTLVLWLMTALLAISGGLALLPHVDGGDLDLIITLIIVVAMGFQNTLHHFIAGAFTTVMTGTVMNWVAGQTERRLASQSTPKAAAPVNPIFLMLLFGAGCLAGALLTHAIGFAAFLPAAVLTAGLAMFEIKRLSHVDIS
jgi:uncharacterized membrane protein YoaK (UPF0700 family)